MNQYVLIWLLLILCVKSQAQHNGNSPLIVIDSVIIGAGSMPDMHPNDIKNITILKDSSAVKKYGAKGMYGVVEITTKDPAKYNFLNLGQILAKWNMDISYPAIFMVNERFIKDTSDIKINESNITSVTIVADNFYYLKDEFNKLKIIKINFKTMNNYTTSQTKPSNKDTNPSEKKPENIMIRGLEGKANTAKK